MTSPLVSVIIPVHNGAATLRRCLTALRASTYPRIELLLVDDSSTEPIAPLADEFGARLVRLEGGPYGPAAARNRGARAAQGEILFFTDADCEVHPDAVQRVVATLADPTVDAVIGSYDDAPADPRFLSQYKNLFHHWVHQQAKREAATFWTGCGGVRRAVFLALGGFDAARYRRPSVEDIEFGVRLCAQGGRIRLDPALRVRHLKRWTFFGLLRTEIFDRGAPWTALILRTRRLPADLNLRPAERINALCATAGTAGLVLGPLWWPAAIIGIALLAATVFRSRRLYQFFAARRGVIFALRAVPLHLLYYLYSAASIGIGLGWHVRERLTSRALRRREHAERWPSEAA
ncbi:MAG: glycosyltransferase [Chloroflexota bacterium]|nr:glycosyltransferase [Dehalococcoidia bacterium]MDW8254230.1 glycosyltransferase [Chloroflexota bacterium]